MAAQAAGAVATIRATALKYPNIAAAYRLHYGGLATTRLDDYPPLVLIEAARIVEANEHGLQCLARSAAAEAARAGEPGTYAARCLSTGFDVTAAQLIKRRTIDIMPGSIDTMLGIAPTLSLALSLW